MPATGRPLLELLDRPVVGVRHTLEQQVCPLV
jgi:hypothetical protein